MQSLLEVNDMQNTPKEWAVIHRIKERVQRQHPHTIVALGDDAFVFKNFPGYSVLCQDMLVEGTHFSRTTATARDIGYKALAVNLSDIAAMGARPHFVQVSLALPEITESWLDQFYDGMCELADSAHCEIIGGDICKGATLTIDVSVHGSCELPIRRHRVLPDDLLLCSGDLGLSHVGLWALKNQNPHFPKSTTKHLRPSPRLDLVKDLQEKREYIHSLMDCSDGLINDALQMAPHLGLTIKADSIAQHPEIQKMAEAAHIPPTEIALWGGEDYELLIAVRPEDAKHFPNWKTLGQWNKSAEVILENSQGSEKISAFRGWSHF